ncbi:hypothetical protein E2C01_094272 [Portunus trituberculatus]|uniref:Uncharacterized protein n=1 Tax=Portunus trituberculatus TaxID=210409 RepID=A0A5B7JX56_PORTR|nr:hypothetical protein [Portunus trituberculatus]
MVLCAWLWLAPGCGSRLAVWCMSHRERGFTPARCDGVTRRRRLSCLSQDAS